jgi:hypothetical protein
LKWATKSLIERVVTLYNKIRGLSLSLDFIKINYPIYGEQFPFQLYALRLLRPDITDEEFLTMMKQKVDQLKDLETEVTPQKKEEILEETDPSQPSLSSQYVEEMERVLPFRMKVRFVYFILFKSAVRRT